MPCAEAEVGSRVSHHGWMGKDAPIRSLTAQRRGGKANNFCRLPPSLASLSLLSCPIMPFEAASSARLYERV